MSMFVDAMKFWNIVMYDLWWWWPCQWI